MGQKKAVISLYLDNNIRNQKINELLGRQEPKKQSSTEIKRSDVFNNADEIVESAFHQPTLARSVMKKLPQNRKTPSNEPVFKHINMVQEAFPGVEIVREYDKSSSYLRFYTSHKKEVDPHTALLDAGSAHRVFRNLHERALKNKSITPENVQHEISIAQKNRNEADIVQNRKNTSPNIKPSFTRAERRFIFN